MCIEISGSTTEFGNKSPISPADQLAGRSRSTKHTSLFKVVGLAGWPCVCANIGNWGNRSANSAIALIMFLKRGTITSLVAFFIISGNAVLLILRGKTKVNVFNVIFRPCASKRSLRKYSTAFTSWLVVFSISLFFEPAIHPFHQWLSSMKQEYGQKPYKVTYLRGNEDEQNIQTRLWRDIGLMQILKNRKTILCLICISTIDGTYGFEHLVIYFLGDTFFGVGLPSFSSCCLNDSVTRLI